MRKSIRVITGEQEVVYEEINRFFRRICDKLEPKPLSRPSQIEVRVNSLYDSNTRTYSDDIVHRLFYRQRVGAAVFESRDDLNYVVFNFFDNSKNSSRPK